jgi:hypothetical protein
MTKSSLVWMAAFLTVALACLTRPQVRAADGTENPVLKKHGLKIVGTLAVVDEEAEIKSKLTEARRISKQLSYSLMQQKVTLSPGDLQKTAKNLTDQINQLRSEMNMTNQQMNAVPKFRNRFVSNDASTLYQQLSYYRSQLQMEINQDSLFLNQLKSQPADPKAKEKIDSDVRDRRDAYHEAILELRKLVDSATAKYDELATNVEVKKALDAIGKGQREKPKLGPSHDFQTNVKTVEKLEQAESSGDKEDTQAKPARRGRRSTKTKQSSKTANAAANSSGTP